MQTVYSVPADHMQLVGSLRDEITRSLSMCRFHSWGSCWSVHFKICYGRVGALFSYDVMHVTSTIKRHMTCTGTVKCHMKSQNQLLRCAQLGWWHNFYSKINTTEFEEYLVRVGQLQKYSYTFHRTSLCSIWVCKYSSDYKIFQTKSRSHSSHSYNYLVSCQLRNRCWLASFLHSLHQFEILPKIQNALIGKSTTRN